MSLKKKVLFLIHDLGKGGAEKVLVNLVNNMDRTKFDISVTVMFGGGVNEKFLASDIHFHAVFPKMIPGNSKIMKLFTPEQLHKQFVKEQYDIEVAYLEGPSTRVISGCKNPNTKLIAWMHGEQKTINNMIRGFRSVKETKACYEKFDRVICVSNTVKENFCHILEYEGDCRVLYNTVESQNIKELAHEKVDELIFDGAKRLVIVGTLKEVKGHKRLFGIIKRLVDEKYNIHLYVMGTGPLLDELNTFIEENDLKKNITMLGYQENPYKYVAKADLFICSSYSEGFSTAATEALIVGTPVCTVEVSGMKEMLGENNEYGVVTDNDEEALYHGIKMFLDNSRLLEDYAMKAKERGDRFSTSETVKAVEEMLLSL